MKKFIPLFIWIAGLVTFFKSFANSGSGVHLQYPTPAQAAEQALENQYFEIGVPVGAGLFVIGFLWAFVRGVLWTIAKIRS